MNWNRIQGTWMQVAGKAKAHWGRLTDDPYDVLEGCRDQLAGKMQLRCAMTRDKVHRQLAGLKLKASEAWLD